MKKRLYTVLLSFAITASSVIAAAPASITPEQLWGLYVRNTATSIRDLNEAMNSLILSMKYAVFVYDQYVDDGTCLTKSTSYLGQTIYLTLNKGTFTVVTGLANGNDFDYLFTIQDTNDTGVYLLKFYFNNLTDMNAVYGVDPPGTGALVVADVGTINAAMAGIKLEIYCYNASGNPAMNFSVVRNQTVAFPIIGNVIYNTQARARVINYITDASPYFTVEVYFHSNLSGGITYNGYHTVAYRTKNEPGYYTTVKTGCNNTSGISDDGDLIEGEVGTGNHNYALFKMSSGNVVFVGDAYASGAIPAGYPTAAEVGSLYTAMEADAGTLFIEGSIDSLGIDINAVGYDNDITP